MAAATATALTATSVVLPVPAGAGDDGRHRVSKGDTLSEVAERLGVSVDDLAGANGIADADHVVIGTWLTVPGGGIDAGAAADADRVHVIVEGENLTSIARRYGVSVATLVSANRLDDPDLVVPGRRLTVPSVGGGPADWPRALRASPSRQAYIPTFELWATRYAVPLELLQAMTWLESGWQPEVVSSTGAVGIGQLMPDTVTFMRVVIGDPSLDPNDPADNIRMSARYLRWLLDQTGGDPGRALAGYYQGLRALQERGIYAETLVYVANVQRLRDRF